MTNPNAYPSQPDQSRIPSPVRVEYNDGEFDLQYQTPGDEIQLGYESPLKHARYLEKGQPNMVAVNTETGNTYLIADGLVVNFRKGTFYAKPEQLLPVKIGEEWDMGDIGNTSRVRSVAVYWGQRAPGEGEAKIDTPGPFKQAQQQLRQFRTQNPNL